MAASRICVTALLFLGSTSAQHTRAQGIHVDITPSHSTNIIKPAEALGAGIDRLPYGAADKLFVDDTIKQILSAGWQTVTYRQNTELHVEAWHWNPQGAWSDPAGKGYFTGSAMPGAEMVRHRDSRRWHGYGRVLAANRWRRGFLLEEQSLSDKTLYGRG